MIVRTPLFALYVHRMRHPDGQPDPHDHPRHLISIVLRGGYTEEYYPSATDSRFHLRRYDRWSAHRKTIGVAHRIVAVDPGTITLCLLGRRRQDWGFYIRGRHLPPSEYLKQAGT